MGYTNSAMVAYTKLSPNHSGQRTHSIDRITPHCVVGQCSAEGLDDWFAKSSTQASSNYGIDKDGRVGLYVEEKNRSWCSSSNANDQRAITIECASDTTEPYAFRDVVYQTLIKLCIDICQRYGKTKLLWLGDKDKTLNYSPAANEMVLTVHRWFANKSCPGNWMYARMSDPAEKVTTALETTAQPSAPETSGRVSLRKNVLRRWVSRPSIRMRFQSWCARLQSQKPAPCSLNCQMARPSSIIGTAMPRKAAGHRSCGSKPQPTENGIHRRERRSYEENRHHRDYHRQDGPRRACEPLCPGPYMQSPGCKCGRCRRLYQQR